MTRRRHSRRGFMGPTGAGLAGGVSAPWVGATTALAARERSAIVRGDECIDLLQHFAMIRDV